MKGRRTSAGGNANQNIEGLEGNQIEWNETREWKLKNGDSIMIKRDNIVRRGTAESLETKQDRGHLSRKSYTSKWRKLHPG